MNIQHLSQRTTCWPLVIVSSAHSSLSPALSHSVLSYRSPHSPIQRILSIIKVLHHCYITTRHYDNIFDKASNRASHRTRHDHGALLLPSITQMTAGIDIVSSNNAINQEKGALDHYPFLRGVKHDHGALLLLSINQLTHIQRLVRC